MQTPPPYTAHSSSAANSKTLRLGILLSSQLAVASAALMARAGLAAGVGPISMAFWRLALATVILSLALVLGSAPKEQVSKAEMGRIALAGICLGWHFATWFISLQFVSVALSTLLVSSSPLWAGLVEWFWHRKPPKPVFWLGLLMALVGVGLVAKGEGFGQGKNLWLGALMATIGAILVVFYLLLGKPLQQKHGTWRTVSWVYGASAVFLLPVLPVLEKASSLMPSNPVAWWAILGMALVPQLLGHTALNWSMRWFAASLVSLTTLLEPVFAALLAWPLFGESLNLHQGLGAVLLLGGIVVGMRSSPSVA